jgi:choline-sulfatase
MAFEDLPARPNILILITDQMRYQQHFPADWIAKNLPSFQRLLDNGLSFSHAFTGACECSPSRAAFVTGVYDNMNGIMTTGPNRNLPLPPPPPPGLPNLATLLLAAGYQVFWKGKWHLLQTPMNDLSPYGFSGWDPPDSGNTLDTTYLGGGTPHTKKHNGNDPRYTDDAVELLTTVDRSTPFCLVVSLVNPHDVHVYTQDPASVGYPATIPDMGVGLPDNFADDLTEKPRAQLLFRQMFDRQRPIGKKYGTSDAGYVNFYAYLQTVVDQQIGRLLDTLDAQGLKDSTLIVRMGDHGEMGMSHGLREKMYVAYDEAIRVPLIFSNPLAFPQAATTEALASLLDLAPTLAAVAGGYRQSSMAGKDLTPVLRDPSTSVRDAALYSYDDNAGVTGVATQIRAIRKHDWMYSVYFLAGSSGIPNEFELYDLNSDPGQLHNLVNASTYQPAILPTWQELNDELWQLADELGSIPPGFVPPASLSLGASLLELSREAVPVEKAGELMLAGK